MKSRLCSLGRVANPRDSDSYCCGWHLALRANPSISSGSSYFQVGVLAVRWGAVHQDVFNPY